MQYQTEKLMEEIKSAGYLQEICKQTPNIVIGTQCGVGKYQFTGITTRNEELVLKFELVMDGEYTDSEKISSQLGIYCFLTASQYLFAFDYFAYA